MFFYLLSTLNLNFSLFIIYIFYTLNLNNIYAIIYQLILYQQSLYRFSSLFTAMPQIHTL